MSEDMDRQSVAATVLLAVCLALPLAAQAAVYKCTSETGGVLFTDSACPKGYTTDLVVADIPAAAEAPRAPLAPAPEAPPPAAPASESVEARIARLEAEAKAARLEADLEIARLQAQLDEQRLRALEGQVDYPSQEPAIYYGGVGFATIPIAPKHFGSCKFGRCGSGRDHFKTRVVPPEKPSCGIFGCTPSIQRRPGAVDAPPPMRRAFTTDKRLHQRSFSGRKARP